MDDLQRLIFELSNEFNMDFEEVNKSQYIGRDPTDLAVIRVSRLEEEPKLGIFLEFNLIFILHFFPVVLEFIESVRNSVDKVVIGEEFFIDKMGKVSYGARAVENFYTEIEGEAAFNNNANQDIIKELKPLLVSKNPIKVFKKKGSK